MKTTIDLGNTKHDMRKQNLVTLKKGGDKYVCSKCGAHGIRKHLSGVMEISGNKKAIEECEKLQPKPKQVRITYCTASGPEFANLTHESIHDVVDCPKEHSIFKEDVWVMGLTEPVRLLPSEYQDL